MGTAILTVDFEDWHQDYRIRYGSGEPQVSEHLERQVDTLLDVLDAASVKATFFCLGLAAAQRPTFVRRIAASGHEIQTHGYGHERVYDLDPERFEADIKKGKAVLEDILGTEVCGYRAPEFSIVPRSAWALDVLSRCGFRFDSSIFPISGPRYGWPGFPRLPIEITFDDGRKLVEFPIRTSVVASKAVPIGGGGYFRLLPYRVISALRRWSRLQTEVFYFHPYEFSTTFLSSREALPDLRAGRARKIDLMQNLNRKTVRRKVERLLSSGEFVTFRQYMERERPKSSVPFSSLA